MQFMIISLLVLALCELPVLHTKKVVVLMQRNVRRSPGAPWRHMMMLHGKKNQFPDNNFAGHPRHAHPHGGQAYRPKDLHVAKDQYPHGGDDFDQGHEEVNHVMVPHGKGITHAVSFGKGYIPYDTYKDHRPPQSHHHDYKIAVPMAQDVQYSPAVHFATGPSYAQAYISQQADAYVGNDDSSQSELQDRSQERGAQKFITGKQVYEPAIRTTVGGQQAVVQNLQALASKPTVYLQPAVAQTTLGASKQGIVLRDSIILDDYHRKVAELTSRWSSNFNNNNLIPVAIGGHTGHQGSVQQIGVARQFDGHNGLQGLHAGTQYVANLGQAQGQQGYAVKEDVVDTPHDFRTTPIQSAPVHQTQTLHPQQQAVAQIVQQQPVQQIIQHPNLQQQPLQQQIVQQPVQQSLQQIIPQTQVPVNYAVQNYPGFVHG